MGHSILRNLPDGAIVGDDEGNLYYASAEFLADADTPYWKNGPAVIRTHRDRLIVPYTVPTDLVQSMNFPGLTIKLDRPVAGMVRTETIRLLPYDIQGHRIRCGYSYAAQLWVVKET